MNCPNCGHATPPVAAARCGHCNFKLPALQQPQAAQSDTTLPCWNCRRPNAAGAERCEHCNAKTQTQSAAPVAAGNPVPAPSRKPETCKPVNVFNHVE